jgi:hypothetical protein
MAKKLPTQAQFLRTANFMLTSPVAGEKESGQCKRWVRQVQEGSGVPSDLSAPTGLDAKETAEWYRYERPQLVCHNGGLPGDIYFWEEDHGEHGHVMIRDHGNKYIGNFKGHGTKEDGDARGSYRMDPNDPPTLIVRTWR